MLHHHRGVVLEIDDRSVFVDTDSRGRVRCHLREPQPEIQVGMWADVRGGGIAGMYFVTPLSVFA